MFARRLNRRVQFGAIDVTNPATKQDPTSLIYGMPVLEVWKGGTARLVKRALASG